MKPTAIICDIDGTLAHMNGRSPYDPTKYHEDTKDDFVHAFKEFDKFLPMKTVRRIVKPTAGKIVEEPNNAKQ